MTTSVSDIIEDFTPEQIEKQVKQKERSYVIDSNELPSVEEVVGKILGTERAEYENNVLLLKQLKHPYPCLEKEKDDSDWKKIKKLYLKIEQWIRANKDQIAFPSWEVAGSLNCAMSPCEIKHVITNKFKEMVASGNLISEESLNNNHARETFYPTTGRGTNDLTRIWGAEFLRSNLRKDSTLNAVEHFLIIDNAAEEIEVLVGTYDEYYPCLSNVKNAYILSKKIEGVPKAWECRFSSKLNDLRYRDFNPSNLIRDSQGTGWIVDTEIKGFEPPKPDDALPLNYLKSRYRALVAENCPTYCRAFKIKVADLNLR